LTSSPGECDLKRNPTQAERASSKIRRCFYPQELFTAEPPKHHYLVGEVQNAYRSILAQAGKTGNAEGILVAIAGG
jgi:hypothetical protein